MCEWFNFSASSLAFDVIHFNFCHSERYVVISYCVFLKNIFIVFDIQCYANFYCTAKRPGCVHIYMYIYIPPRFIFSSILVSPKRPDRVPRAAQQDLIAYPFDMSSWASADGIYFIVIYVTESLKDGCAGQPSGWLRETAPGSRGSSDVSHPPWGFKKRYSPFWHITGTTMSL